MPPAAAVASPPSRGVDGEPGGGPSGDEEGRAVVVPDDGEADPSVAAAAPNPEVAPDASPTLKVAAVARRLGVAPATLRTWARRYGLGPSAHTAGAHRQYSLADLDRLMVMRRMTLEGYSPAEAARVALQAPVPATAGATAGTTSGTTGSGGPGAGARRGPPPAWTTTPSVRSLARAASALEQAECARQLEAHTAVGGVLETWTSLVRPVLQVLSDRVGAVAPGRSPALVLEAALLQALRSAAEGGPDDGARGVGEGPARTLVLSPCAADPPQPAAGPPAAAADLLAHVVAAALREHGVASSVLPGAHPAERAAAVAEQVDATTLLLVADTPVPADRVDETARLVDPRGARVVLVGRGWEAAVVPGSEEVADLGDVVAAVASA
ncbi:MerR family transcriptional regulator [Pseudokineococcus basanitobsidens]|uniref:MerR family transcriptional regulator n=1 Tax=Pseudokineococcus basanitobsidens TaxID=1926649 RepID=A0ABU8RH40_9ACTN